MSAGQRPKPLTVPRGDCGTFADAWPGETFWTLPAPAVPGIDAGDAVAIVNEAGETLAVADVVNVTARRGRTSYRLRLRTSAASRLDVLAVPCPTCRQEAAWPCVNAAGRETPPHPDRSEALAERIAQ